MGGTCSLAGKQSDDIITEWQDPYWDKLHQQVGKESQKGHVVTSSNSRRDSTLFLKNMVHIRYHRWFWDSSRVVTGGSLICNAFFYYSNTLILTKPVKMSPVKPRSRQQTSPMISSTPCAKLAAITERFPRGYTALNRVWERDGQTDGLESRIRPEAKLSTFSPDTGTAVHWDVIVSA